jgi:hypothetical protein
MMKVASIIRCGLQIVFLLNIACAFGLTQGIEGIQNSYKKVADDLMSIRKDFPNAQPKVYAMLDQLNKLYSSAKTAVQEEDILKRKLLEKAKENVSLKQELMTAKNEKKAIDAEKDVLEKKLEEENAKVLALSHEHKELTTKLVAAETANKKIEQMHQKLQPELEKNELTAMADIKNQPNLSRISTSEPNSPR